MKISNLFLKFTALAFILMLVGSGAIAQVSYSSKNTATVSGMAPGNVPVDDISNSGVVVDRLNGDETPIAFPMIGLAKTAGTPVLQGNGTYNVTYTLQVKNYSTIPLNTIQITDDISLAFPSPATFSMVGVVAKLAGNSTNGSGAIAVNPAFDGSSDKNLLSPASSSLLGSGDGSFASITFTMNVNVNGAHITYYNTATTTAKTVTPDPVNVTDVSHNDLSPNQNDANRTPLFYNDPTPVVLAPYDIEVNKMVNITTPDINSNVIFTIKVKNNGLQAAAPVIVTDLLPAGFEYVSHVAPGITTYIESTGEWAVGTLNSGGANELTLTITAKVLPNKTVAEYTNTASSDYPGDAVVPNNSSTVTVVPAQVADLSITNTDGKATYTPGTTNTYTVVVTNGGPSDVTGATITNTLPAGVTGSWTAVYAGGATGAANGTGSISEAVNIPSSGTITYTYVVNVPSGTTADFVNTATVALPAGITDPTPLNNTETDTDTQSSAADLSISNTDGKGTYTPGTTNTYTVVVTNGGPSDVTGATVTNALPTGVTGSWTAVYTGGATGAANGTGSISETVNIPSSGTITYTYVVNVPSGTTADFVNTATVALPTGVADPTPLNNTATDTDTQSSAADLSISNTDGKATYTPGTSNTYTVVVTNGGPSDVTGATVTNTLPTGVTGSWTAVYTGGATGAASGTNSISETVNIPSSGTITYTFVVNVPSGTTADFINTATVALPTGVTDPTPLNNTATDTDTQGNAADLSISNTDGKGTYTPGTTNTYTVVATNGGPSDVTGATVTNTLPAGVTGNWTAVYAGGATGAANGTGSISETVNIPSGGTITYTYVVNVPSGTTTDFINTATVALPAGLTDPTLANNTATDTDTQSSAADLSISNTDGKATYTPGTTNTYTVVVTNGGPSDVTGATVTNTLPTGVTGSWTAVYAGGATGAANGTGSISETVNIPSSGTITYTYVVNVPSGTTTDFINTATVALPAGLTDPTLANNTATDTDTRSGAADLSITNTDGKATYTPGTTNTYTVVVTNSGPSDVTGATVTNTLPTGVTGNWTAVYAGGATGAANGTGSISETVNLPVGSTITYTLTIVVPASHAGNFTSVATVATPTGVTDPTLANNSATDIDTQNNIVDLSITNTDGKTSYTPGTSNTYTVVVNNNGPGNANGATVTNTLPTGVTGTWTAVYAGGATGTANGTGSIAETVNIPLGGAITYTYVVNVPSGTTGDFVNTATVTVPAGATDPTPGNNSAIDTDTQSSLIDLAITETVDNVTPDVGSNVTFTLTAVNNGPGNATGVKVTDLLPAGYTFVRANTGSGTYNSTTGIWDISNLANGASATVTLVARVNADRPPADYVNPVTISGNQTESTLTNNNDTKTVAPVPLTDLAILKTISNTNPDAGSNASFTVTVSNNGPSNASQVTVTDLLKPGYAFVSAATTIGTYNNTTGIWAIGNMVSGSTASLTVTVGINPTGPYDNTASVTGLERETNLANNTATVVPVVSANPTIGLAKAAISAVKSLNGSYDVTYRLTVGNYGVVDMNNVSITDDLRQTFKGDVIKVKSIKSLGALKVNTSYNGDMDTQMLLPGNTLVKTQIEELEMVVNVSVTKDKGTYLNTAIAEGTSAAGLKATDLSTDGLKPDPNTSGNISPAVPTPIDLQRPKEFIPQGFSPNNDGINDRFVIENTGFKHLSIEIFNRWGNRIYRSADYKNDWDGRCNEGIHIGEDLPVGTYFYIVRLDGQDKYVGYITLNR